MNTDSNKETGNSLLLSRGGLLEASQIVLTPEQVTALVDLLGIYEAGRPASYLVGMLHARVEAQPHDVAVDLAGKPEGLRRLAGVGDDADAGEVFRSLMKKYADQSKQQIPTVLAGASVGSKPMTPKRKQELMQMAGYSK